MRVWDTAGMDLIPLFSLSVHGQVTNLAMAVNPEADSKQGRWAGRAESRHNLVATTQEGDVVAWSLDAASSGQVLGVGMISMEGGAVLQADMVRGSRTPGGARPLMYVWPRVRPMTSAACRRGGAVPVLR